jgi:hypothetical protein
MNTINTSTALVQRIEAALSGNDLHASEIAGLIEAASQAEIRLQNLISQLNILLTAVTAAEKAAQPQKPELYWANEPTVNRHHRAR